MDMRYRIVYLCPRCEEELSKGAKCPHCSLRAVVMDLGEDEREMDRYYDDLQERGNRGARYP